MFQPVPSNGGGGLGSFSGDSGPNQGGISQAQQPPPLPPSSQPQNSVLQELLQNPSVPNSTAMNSPRPPYAATTTYPGRSPMPPTSTMLSPPAPQSAGRGHQIAGGAMRAAPGNIQPGQAQPAMYSDGSLAPPQSQPMPGQYSGQMMPGGPQMATYGYPPQPGQQRAYIQQGKLLSSLLLKCFGYVV